jgi:hypothetical protein
MIDKRTVHDRIDDQLASAPEQMFTLIGDWDDALLGLNVLHGVPIYSVKRCIRLLMAREGLTEVKATKRFEEDIRYAYRGMSKPIWCDDEFLSEDAEDAAVNVDDDGVPLGEKG